MANSDSRISPTAHYTSYVWFKHGMSHPALTSRMGRVMHGVLRPMNLAYERFASRPGLDQMLLARHRVLDHLLEQEILAGRVGQVIEVAAGFSPRGFRFVARFPELRYLETDLPEQAAEKRRLLADARLIPDGAQHDVLALDALADDGPDSLRALARDHLDPDLGTAIITEGLLGYFDLASVQDMWSRFARTLSGFPHGLYLSDLNLGGDFGGMRTAKVFRVLLSAFARGTVHLHFERPEEAEIALERAGFTSAALHLPGEFDEVDVPARDKQHMVRLIEARTEHKMRQP